MDFYNADETADQEDEDKFAAGFEPFRENLVFLIDAQPAMFEETNLVDCPDFNNVSWFDAALKTTREILKARIISSDNDQLAVVFYGTRESQNNNAFENVYTFQDLDVPDAQRIRGLESLLGGQFEEHIGSKGSADPEQLHYALWTASQLLSGASSKASKRILIFTRDANPAGEAGTFKEQILSRAQELTETNAKLDILPMIPQDQNFDMSFWSAVLLKTDEDQWEYEGSNIPDRLTDLAGIIRHKAYRKRVLSRDVRWSFGAGFEIAVALYAMIQPAVKGTYTYVKAQNNEPLRSETAYICNDTGAVLTKANLTKSLFPNPTQYRTARYPRILLTTEELQEIKSVQPKGLRLLGFKSRSMLKHYHQLRSPTFLYPDERSMSGSTQTFIAFHATMLKKQRMAICSFVRTRAAEPRLVALLPQEEEVDEFGVQVTPPGMNMVYLPYSDDVRQPEADTSFTGLSHPKADAKQVEAAEHLLSKLNLGAFASSDIPNPTLQRHYQVLECYALNEPPPEEINDGTKPDDEGMQKNMEAIIGFRDAVYGDGNDDDYKVKPAASRKRKSAEEEQDVKQQAAAIDFKGLATDGKLGKLTVNDLKKYCEVNQLPKSGKKDDIVRRIAAHLGIH
ncbi:hypothetical protein WJX79_009209 [Trebouxia sp. C0005]